MRHTRTDTLSPAFFSWDRPDGSGATVIDRNSPTWVKDVRRSNILRRPMTLDGWRDPTPYSCVVTSADAGFINARWWNNDTRAHYTYVGKFAASTDLPSIYVSRDELDNELPSLRAIDQAVIKARNNVADRVASFGESLVELMQTIQSLGALATNIDEFLQAVAEKDYNRVARLLKIPPRGRKHRRAVVRYNRIGIQSVSNAFLCWNFGLQPIISDMVSLAILMGEGKPLRVVGKGLAPGKDALLHLEKNSHTSGYSAGLEWETTHQVKTSSGTFVRLDYTMSFEALRKLNSMGLTDGAATLWAVVPYSFLVDFVLPVSEVLRSLTATVGLTFRGGSATRFSKIDKRYLFARPKKVYYADTPVTFQVRCNDLSGLRMERSVFMSDPNPVTLWLKDPLRAFPVMTAMALLGQAIKGKHHQKLTK